VDAPSPPTAPPAAPPADLDAYLRRIPDEPAWIDARGVLLSGRCRILGGGDPERGFWIRSTDFPFAVAVGEPAFEAMLAAVAEARPDFHLHLPPSEAAPGLAAVARRLPGWRRAMVILHRRVGGNRVGGHPPAELPGGAGVTVFGGEGDEHSEGELDLTRVSEAVRREVALARRRRCPLSVVWVDGRPVSFCYAAWQTERLWDVAVQTLAGWRRRGFAAAAFEALGHHLVKQGLEPVWGAYGGNPASLALARRLGFTEAARYFALAPPRPEASAP
jgi:hypothetical protein